MRFIRKQEPAGGAFQADHGNRLSNKGGGRAPGRLSAVTR
jgi:hypothetical protein